MTINGDSEEAAGAEEAFIVLKCTGAVMKYSEWLLGQECDKGNSWQGHATQGRGRTTQCECSTEKMADEGG